LGTKNNFWDTCLRYYAHRKMKAAKMLLVSIGGKTQI